MPQLFQYISVFHSGPQNLIAQDLHGGLDVHHHHHSSYPPNSATASRPGAAPAKPPGISPPYGRRSIGRRAALWPSLSSPGWAPARMTRARLRRDGKRNHGQGFLMGLSWLSQWLFCENQDYGIYVQTYAIQIVLLVADYPPTHARTPPPHPRPVAQCHSPAGPNMAAKSIRSEPTPPPRP